VNRGSASTLFTLKGRTAEGGAGGSPTIEVVTALVSPQAANIERVGFAVLGVV
jgi:hypothetical protein